MTSSANDHPTESASTVDSVGRKDGTAKPGLIPPFLLLRPCRSRMLAGLVMLAVLTGMVFLLAG